MRVFREREAGAVAGRFFRRGGAARRPEASGDDQGPLEDPVAPAQDAAEDGRPASRPRTRPAAPCRDDDADAASAWDAAGPADTGGDQDAESARPRAFRPRTGAPAPAGTPGASPGGAPDLSMSASGGRLPAEERLRQFTRGRVRLSGPGVGGSGDEWVGGVRAAGDGCSGDGLGGEGADSPFAARARLSSRTRSAPRRIWDIEDECGAEAEPDDAGPDRWDAPRPAPHATVSRDGTPPKGHGTHDAPPQGRAVSRPPAARACSVPQAGPASDEDEMIAYARAQVARIAEAGMADDLGDGHGAGRAKTRLLGFQSRDFAARDPFSQGASDARRGPMFPVGWVVVTGGPGRGASYALTAGVATLGRGDDQTVCLDFGDTAISRQAHASIAYDPESNRFYLGAGAKSNLVRLNDRPVLATEQLEDGDTIRIGETTLRFAAFCGPDFAWTGAAGSGGGRDAAGEG